MGSVDKGPRLQILSNLPDYGKPPAAKAPLMDIPRYCCWRTPYHWAMSVIFYLILYLVMAGLWLGYYYLIKCLYIPNPADGGPPLYSYNTGWAPSYFGTIGSEPSLGMRPEVKSSKISMSTEYDISNAQDQQDYEKSMNDFVDNEAPPGYESSLGPAATINVPSLRARRQRRRAAILDAIKVHWSNGSLAGHVRLADIIPGLDRIDLPPIEYPWGQIESSGQPDINMEEITESSISVQKRVKRFDGGDIVLIPTNDEEQAEITTDPGVAAGTSVSTSSSIGGQSSSAVEAFGQGGMTVTRASGGCGGQGLGYADRQPCFLLRPPRIFGWKPEAFTSFEEMKNHMPKKIPDEYYGVAQTNMVPNVMWVACYPYEGGERLQKLMYVGPPVGGTKVNGFPIDGYFPPEPRSKSQRQAALRSGQPENHPMPYVYLKLFLKSPGQLRAEAENGTTPKKLAIQCFQLAKNVPISLSAKSGMSSFSVESGAVSRFQCHHGLLCLFISLSSVFLMMASLSSYEG